jgi:hypothetical protein
MPRDWTVPTAWDEVCRRAGGRRRYNAGRRFLRDERRARIVCRLAGTGLLYERGRSGLQAVLARELRVSPSTISRDLRALRSPGYRMPVLGERPAHLPAEVG